MVSFNLETALSLANQLVLIATNRYLTDIETAVFTGAWSREDYDFIAAKAQYSTGYISQDVAPKLWKILSEALGEKVRKNNFKQALKRFLDRNPDFLDSKQGSLDSFSNSNPTTAAIRVLETDRSNSTSPLPTYPSGAVLLGSNYYIERREIESKIEAELIQPGALVRIKAPQEMGKTSIVLRVLDALDRQGFLSAYLNFEQADSDILNHLDRLLRWMFANMNYQLQLESNLERYWQEEMGCKLSSTLYLQNILESINRPLILVLNQVNQVFEYASVAKDFLPLIRSWYEESKRIQTWQKLRIVMVHSTDVYVQLNYHQSPFNVGLPIQITPFSRQDIQQLALRYQVELTDEEIDQLFEVLGGQPALVHVAIYHLSQDGVGLSDLLKTAATSNGIYRHHLQRQWTALNEHPELLNAVQSILEADNPVTLEPHILHRLSSMGLIDAAKSQLSFRCELYRVYFESQRQGDGS